MNKQEAIQFISDSLLFESDCGDYCSDLNGTPIKEIGNLLRILEEENGELTLLGNHPEYGDIYIIVDMYSDVTYKTVSPGEGNFKAMEAVYALIP